MFRIKKLLCLLLAVMMICSLLPAAAFADGAGGCTKQEDCTAETHEEGCPKFVPAKSSCTKADDCAAETHEEGCPKFVPAKSSCTKAEDCTAETHEEGCPKFVPAKSSCTKAEDCTAETHEEGCPKFVPAKSSCTKAEDCAAETHEEGCLSLKKGEPEPEVPASVQAFLDAVALIPADITADNAEEVGELLYGQVADAYEALLGTAYEEREDVQEAAAVYKAAIAALDTVLDVDKSTYYTPPLDGYTAHDIFYNNDQPECYLYLGIHPNKPKGTHTNPSEALSVKIGETGGTQRLYTYSVSCGRCGAILHEETAEWITVEPNNTNYFSNSNPEVIENITWGLAGYVPESTSESGYAGFPALAIGFSGVKPGTTTMKFMTWQEYNYQLGAGRCLNCRSYISGANVNGWLQNKETLNISVNADYSLSYNANAGSDPVTDMPTPNPDTYTGPVTSHEFTVSTAVPKRDGYTFKGWAETAAATEATYTSENSVTLNWSEGFGSTENPVSKTLYAVWEENTPPSSEPSAPTNEYLEGLLNANAVKVKCVNDDATHAVKEVTYNLIPSSYQINSVTGDAENGYQCTLTVFPAMYLLAFGADDGVLCGHTLDPDTQESATITLEYVDKAWKVVADSAPVTFTVTCATPPASDIDWYGLIIEKWIAQPENGIIRPGDDVHYKIEVTNNTGKQLKNIVVYGELDSRLLFVSATPKDGVCNLEQSQWVIPSLGKDESTNLDLHVKVNDDASGTIPNVATIIGAITKDGGELPGDIRPSDDVSFTVDGTTPDKPTDDALKNLFGQTIMVRCNNSEATHEDKNYGLLAGGYTVSEVTGDAESGYTCTITVSADPYVAAYNEDVPSGHKLADGQPTSQDITLSYGLTNSKWKLPNLDGPITFNVKCGDEPASTYTYSLSYDANTSDEVTGMPASNPDTYTGPETSHTFTVSSANPQREGYTFKGWAERAAATTADAQDSYTLTSEKPTMTLYAVWEQNTTQPTPPPEPGKPDETTVRRLLPQAVKIDCINTGASHNRDETYGLIDGSFTVDNVEEKETGVFTCTVTIQAAKYVDEYNKTNAGHSLATGEALSKTITLKYDAAKTTWTVPANAAPVVFQVVCSTSQPATDWSKLTITKTVSPTGTVMPGDTVTYTITVTNNTGKILSGITVSETLDRTKLESFVASADKDYNFTSGTWRIWALANGSSTTLTISAKVKADATGTINNTATITGAGDGGNGLPQGSGGSSSVSITVGTPAPMNKFTLSYNANGGKGAPSSQSVETTAKIVVMTVSSVKPTRDGYHFCGWALTPNGHVSYRPGNEITLTGDVTLYAVWATPTSSPQTGDSSNVALWAAMAGMSLAAGAVVLFVLKKRKAE